MRTGHAAAQTGDSLSQVHVLLMPSWYPAPEEARTVPFIEDQARVLLENGLRVGVLATLLRYTARDWLYGRIRSAPAPIDDQGLPVSYCYLSTVVPRWRAVSYAIAGRAVLPAFREYVARHGRPDVLHAHVSLLGGYCAHALSNTHGIPFVVTEHHSDLINPNVRMHRTDRRLVARTLRAADRAIFVSTHLKRAVEAQMGLDGERAVVVPNIIPREFFVRSPAVPLGPLDPLRLLVVAGLVPLKRVARAVEAVGLLRDRGQNVVLRIIGHGPEEPALRRLVARLGLESLVTLLGYQERRAVLEELRSAHALLSTSEVETFGVAVAEALAVGRPVVTTDAGGPRDFVMPANGILLSGHSASDVADGVQTLRERYSSFDGPAISEACQEHFAPEAVYAQMRAVYDAVLASPRGRGAPSAVKPARPG